MPIALLRLRHAEMSDSVRRHLGETYLQVEFPSIIQICAIGSKEIKGNESSNSIHLLSVYDRDVTSHCDIANVLADNLYTVKLKSRI